MSAAKPMNLYDRGALFSIPVAVCIARWGAGADLGKYHVYLSGVQPWDLLVSLQCVVDDFGDLVRVES